ncbi:ATP-binding cassette domain-containing protein [Microbacterium karelineae]|uniref:ATP-binding cassette domain-containing protein n=1 Tax=Microbacterium karelineae TaxID=2654283 RepID=UPI0012EA8F3A|nr:ATP-binding cassette domain-containing protein [Microbacterium karelineae]
MQTAVEFRGVSKTFPDGTLAVDSLDLVVARGTTTCFVGSSGSGKTTALRMINRMVDPTSGAVLVGGDDVATREPVALRRSIGYVMQHAGLLPHRTVLDNVATVPVLAGANRREARERAREIMGAVGLDGALATRYPAQLSGGQQQRVGVARALAADADLLLMDEPFGAVDPVVRADLQEELRRLRDQFGKTIVFVTHDIDEAFLLGDQVALFRPGGRLAQLDSPRQLLDEPADDFVAAFIEAGRPRSILR